MYAKVTISTHFSAHAWCYACAVPPTQVMFMGVSLQPLALVTEYCEEKLKKKNYMHSP